MARTRRPENTELTHPETIRFQKAIKKLIVRVEAYAKREKLTAAQVSKRVFGHKERLDDLKGDKSFLAPDTYERILDKLDQLEAEERVA